MRAAVSIPVVLLLLAAGCGYVGPVVPPSPMLPVAVGDLSVVERGDKLYISFSTPAATTDALNIKQFSDIELRMGPDLDPFDFDRWAASSRLYDLQLPPENDAEESKPVPMHKTIPASEWQGKKITVAVRTAVKGEKHFSSWSNRIVLDVVAPLRPPVIAVDASPDGYRLTWQAEGENLHYNILRSSPTEKVPVLVGTAEKPEFVDATSQWDTPYEYSVVALEGPSIESLPSTAVAIEKPDTFPPAVPTGLTGLAGPSAVELSWSRSPEPDLKGYLVYRSSNNGPFAVIGELTTLPTFSDTKAEHGRTYLYSVSSIDNKDNESEKSKPVEVTY